MGIDDKIKAEVEEARAEARAWLAVGERRQAFAYGAATGLLGGLLLGWLFL